MSAEYIAPETARRLMALVHELRDTQRTVSRVEEPATTSDEIAKAWDADRDAFRAVADAVYALTAQPDDAAGDQHTEYRVIVNGAPCTDGTLSGGSGQGHTHSNYGEAVEHADWHRKQSAVSTEIQSRTVTVTGWTTEDGAQ